MSNEAKNMIILAQRLDALIKSAEAYKKHLLDLREKQQGVFGSPAAEQHSFDLHFRLESAKEADVTLWNS
jgi:hypothetical protein